MPLCANHARNILKHASKTYYVLKDAIIAMKQEVIVTLAYNAQSAPNFTRFIRVLA